MTTIPQEQCCLLNVISHNKTYKTFLSKQINSTEIVLFKVEKVIGKIRSSENYIYNPGKKVNYFFKKILKMAEVDQKLDFMETTPMPSLEVENKSDISEEVAMNFKENLAEVKNQQKRVRPEFRT